MHRCTLLNKETYASLYLTPIFFYILWMRRCGTIHDNEADVEFVLHLKCRSCNNWNLVARNFGLKIPAVSAKEEKLMQKAVKHL